MHTQQAAELTCQESQSRWELHVLSSLRCTAASSKSPHSQVPHERNPNKNQLHGDLCFPSREFLYTALPPASLSLCSFCLYDLLFFFSLRLCISYLRHTENKRKHEIDEGRIQRNPHLITILYYLMEACVCMCVLYMCLCVVEFITALLIGTQT